MSLRVVPVSFRDACGFVQMWHRHHSPPAGCKFCVGTADEQDVLRSVVIVGRPVARLLDYGLTLEVTRAATDGTRNACSLLYAAAWRAAKPLGYRRLVTYTWLQHAQPVRRRAVDRGPRPLPGRGEERRMYALTGSMPA